MNVDAVVDVGNSRIKWGRCASHAVAEVVALPPDDPVAWSQQMERWQTDASMTWAVSGVHPERSSRLVDWLQQRGHRVCVLERAGQLPLRVCLEHPDRVGMDRLLNAVAASSRRGRQPAVIVDAGSAVTVDWVDEEGTFCGGAIFPGLRLMAKSLNDYTALLPVIPINRPLPAMPGPSTAAAIEAGVYYAVVGGIRSLVSRLTQQSPIAPVLFLTGGDAGLLQPAIDESAICWPEMTLEGVRISAEAMP